ncbi:MAG: class I SAM-dependent methyltransferase, partial [Deltaproteobacteria bacterium]|nr:class I SAM-dependent methyltransferase [Deltaproteobacteria bacterium]
GRDIPPEPPRIGLCSKPTTQADLESDWVAYWCNQLGIRPVYNRKIWELCYVLQAFSEGVPGFLSGGARGIGFGCGREPLPSLMAKLGHDIVATDLGAEASIGRGWAETGQHMGRADDAYHEAIVDRATFDQRVSARAMDMNRLDRDLDGQFDFCWSVCALEHLGSIDQGLDFIENSLRVLRPGGVAVHTTEFNYAEDSETIDHWPTVLFQPRHFEQIAQRLERSGFEVARLDFDVGDAPLDRFIDVPPYLDGPEATQLKLAIDGFRCTCFGLIVRRPA